jgi:hypothetical protein
MAEKYARGALSIIIKFDGMPRRDADQRHYCCAGSRWRKGVTVHCSSDVPVWSYDVERRVAGRPQNWRYFDVLVRVVQLTELIQVHAFPTDKGFRSLKGVFHPLAGCFHSVAGGFETDQGVACRELHVAILRPVVGADHFPRGVVEGGPQIVDSVAYYRGESARQFFEKPDADAESRGCRVGLDAKTVWFFSDEKGELPFQIGNVVIGPLDFLFSAGAFNGDAVRELAAQFLALAEKQGTTVPLMVGHRQMGAALTYTGDIAQGRAHFDQALGLYDPVAHRPLATRFGQDVRVTVLFQRSLSLWRSATLTVR